MMPIPLFYRVKIESLGPLGSQQKRDFTHSLHQSVARVAVTLRATATR